MGQKRARVQSFLVQQIGDHQLVADVQAGRLRIQLAGTGKTVSLAFTVPPEVFDILNGVAAFRGLK